MEIISDFSEYKSNEPSSVTMGKFDGIHRGHRQLMESVVRDKSLKSVVISFDIFPAYILDAKEKAGMLEKYGIDFMMNCNFSASFMKTEPDDFIKKYLVDILHVKSISVGHDFRFGYGRAGDINLLKDRGVKYSYELNVIDDVIDEGRVVSSTWIRNELAAGHIEKVNELLGYNYFVTGEIVHGRQLGHKIGFPTTNIIPSRGKLLPKYGVYVSMTEVGGKKYKGITNIGIKPTVNGQIPGVETYLYDCDEDLYGLEQKVELLKFVRAEKRFEDLDDLMERLKKDIRAGERYFR